MTIKEYEFSCRFGVDVPERETFLDWLFRRPVRYRRSWQPFRVKFSADEGALHTFLRDAQLVMADGIHHQLEESVYASNYVMTESNP